MQSAGHVHEQKQAPGRRRTGRRIADILKRYAALQRRARAIRCGRDRTRQSSRSRETALAREVAGRLRALPGLPTRHEMHTVLVVSTAHLTRRDAALLDALPGTDTDADNLVCWQRAEGYLVFCTELAPEDLTPFSPAFRAALLAAHVEGYDWVMFDADGRVIDGLPVAPW